MNANGGGPGPFGPQVAGPLAGPLTAQVTAGQVAGFKWAGFQTYNTSENIGITDDDSKMDWFGHEQGRLAQMTINGGGGHDIFGGGMMSTTFTTVDGQSVTEDMLFVYGSGTGWHFVPTLGSAFGEGAHIDHFHGWSNTGGVNYTEVICFTPASLIHTPAGPRAAATLCVGDRVVTADNGAQPIRWIGRTTLSPARRLRQDLHPVCIRAGAFGCGLPSRDLYVSPQHRFCLTGSRLLLDFGLDEALAPAVGLLNGHSILRPRGCQPLEYIHILFDRHQVIFANGLACESFHPAGRVVATLARPVRRELFSLFPDLARNGRGYGHTARPCLRRREAASLTRPRLLVA